MFQKDKIPHFFFTTFYNLGLLIVILAFIILAQKTLIEFEFHDKLQETQNIIKDISKDINKTEIIETSFNLNNKNTINDFVNINEMYLINSKNKSFMTFVSKDRIEKIDKYYIKRNFDINDYVLVKTDNNEFLEGNIEFEPQGVFLTTNLSQKTQIKLENILGGIIAYDN